MCFRCRLGVGWIGVGKKWERAGVGGGGWEWVGGSRLGVGLEIGRGGWVGAGVGGIGVGGSVIQKNGRSPRRRPPIQRGELYRICAGNVKLKRGECQIKFPPQFFHNKNRMYNPPFPSHSPPLPRPHASLKHLLRCSRRRRSRENRPAFGVINPKQSAHTRSSRNACTIIFPRNRLAPLVFRYNSRRVVSSVGRAAGF